MTFAMQDPSTETCSASVQRNADVPAPAVTFAMHGERYVVVGITSPSPLALAGLTASERDVARAILDGMSNRAIAEARGTATRTVANQIAALFRKLGIGSRAELGACIHRRARAQT